MELGCTQIYIHTIQYDTIPYVGCKYDFEFDQ